jgi:hypothetical protein
VRAKGGGGTAVSLENEKNEVHECAAATRGAEGDEISCEVVQCEQRSGLHKQQHGVLSSPLHKVSREQRAVATTVSTTACESINYGGRDQSGRTAVSEQLHHQSNLQKTRVS